MKKQDFLRNVVQNMLEFIFQSNGLRNIQDYTVEKFIASEAHRFGLVYDPDIPPGGEHTVLQVEDRGTFACVKYGI